MISLAALKRVKMLPGKDESTVNLCNQASLKVLVLSS